MSFSLDTTTCVSMYTVFVMPRHSSLVASGWTHDCTTVCVVRRQTRPMHSFLWCLVASVVAYFYVKMRFDLLLPSTHTISCDIAKLSQVIDVDGYIRRKRGASEVRQYYARTSFRDYRILSWVDGGRRGDAHDTFSRERLDGILGVCDRIPEVGRRRRGQKQHNQTRRG